jgi:HEAT repeat protein
MLDISTYTDDPTTAELLTRLVDFRNGDFNPMMPPDDLREAFAAAGPEMTPALIKILQDDSLNSVDAPGAGWLPVEAARFLGERGDAAAIEPMIEILGACDPDDIDDILEGTLSWALGKMGPPAVEPLLRAYRDAPYEELRHAYLSSLSTLGVHDERIKQPLRELLDSHPTLAAMLFAGYDDPDVIPELTEALAALAADESADRDDSAILEVTRTIEDLSGELSPAQRELQTRAQEQIRADYAKLERLRAEKQALINEIDIEKAARALMHARHATTYHNDPRESLGRNDPCWCGSGKKYKRCHWADDNR